MTHLEIKARCRDLGAVRAAAERVATQRLGLDEQVDTYFRTRAGRLKLRESSLSGGQLVPYLRPDEHGPKRARYQVIPIEDAAGLKVLLSEILDVHRVVRKRREIFVHENVRIHIDRVEELGEFVELEALYDGSPAAEIEQRRLIDYLMKELGIEQSDLLATSYEGMIDA